jgi:hypothetical protein
MRRDVTGTLRPLALAAILTAWTQADVGAQQLLWTYSESGTRSFAGVTPDGHSVLVAPQANSVSVERLDADGAPEAPFVLDLSDPQAQGDVVPIQVEVDATGALHVTATAQPPSADLQYRYYRFSATGAAQWVLSSAADSNVCARSRLTEAGGRVFLCDEVLGVNPDFELRFRISRYGPNGLLEFSLDPAVGLDNSATKSASASVVLASGVNGRAAFGGVRSVTLNGVIQPRALFAVVVNADGNAAWNQDYAWSGTGNQIEPPWSTRAELGSGGELALYGEGYGVAGTDESQYTVVRFGANGSSGFTRRLGDAIGNGNSGLVGKGRIDASAKVLAAGRCVEAPVTLIPCYAAMDDAGTVVVSSFGVAAGAAPSAFPGVVDVSVGLADETLLALSADSAHTYLRRLAATGQQTWELGFSHADEASKSARLGVDSADDFYYALQWAPFSFEPSDRIEIRKFGGGDIFRDSFE